MPIIAALGRWRQKDEELKVSLNNIGSLRQPGLQDTLSSGERRGKKKKAQDPHWGWVIFVAEGVVFILRPNFHLSACMET